MLIFGKNLSNFVSPDMKLHNLYCHNNHIQIPDDIWLIGHFYVHHRVMFQEKIKFSHTTIDDVLEVAENYSFPPLFV